MSIKEKFYIREGLVVNGDTIITGSVTTSVGFTGSLEGTASYSTTAQSVVGIITSASYATNADSASYTTTALSSSYATTAQTLLGSVTSASHADTADAVNPLSQTLRINYNGGDFIQFYDAYSTKQLSVDTTSQFTFNVSPYGPIYFGNFAAPAYGKAGFSIPGAVVMVVDAVNTRGGFGGGISLITTGPRALLDVWGKADEVQLLVTANSSQTNDIAQFKNSSGATTVKVDSAGTLVSTLQVLPTSSPTSPVNGSVYWDSNSATLFIYDGSNWKSVQLM